MQPLQSCGQEKPIPRFLHLNYAPHRRRLPRHEIDCTNSGFSSTAGVAWNINRLRQLKSRDQINKGVAAFKNAQYEER